MERKERAAALSWAYLAVVAAVLVVANVIGWGVNKRFDVTKNERFTLSKGSANLVGKGLKENMEIKLYVTRGLPTLDLFVEDLTNLMKEYERASGGKLHYEIIEPKTDEQKEEAKSHCSNGGCQPLQMMPFGEGSESADQATITQGYLGLVMEYGSEEDTIPQLSPDNSQGLEFWITNKIRNLRDKVEDSYPYIGLIKKEGISVNDENLVPSGRGPGPSMKGILSQHFPFYKFCANPPKCDTDTVDLEEGKKPIDDKLTGVIIMQSDKDWTDAELARIDQFLMKGDKSALIIAGAVNMKASDATMKAELNTRNLDKLLGAYGVEMKKEAVFDWGVPFRFAYQGADGRQQWFSTAAVASLQHDDGASDKEQMLDNKFVGFFRMEGLAVPFPSPLVAHPEKQPKATLKTVMRTSPSATVDTDSPVDMSIKNQGKPKGEYGQRDIAIEVSGVLKSAFADKKPEGFDGDIVKESKTPSRVLCIAAGQFLANPFARAGNPPPLPPQMAMMGPIGGDPDLQALGRVYAQMEYMTKAILGFKNLLDWVSNDTDLMAVSAKLLGEDSLTYSDLEKPKVDPSKDDEKSLAKKREDFLGRRKSLQNSVERVLIGLPVVLFAAFGFIRWRMREANRSRVRLA